MGQGMLHSKSKMFLEKVPAGGGYGWLNLNKKPLDYKYHIIPHLSTSCFQV